MTEASVPVDLFNPGQVFACLGFLEAADVLCGNSEGGFDWSNEAEVKFCLSADVERNPFEVVLKFLGKAAEIKAVAPDDWRPKKEPASDSEKQKFEKALCRLKKSDVFPCPSPETNSALPVQITGVNKSGDKKDSVLDHWTDGSNRNDFKLYSGNRSALDITSAMLSGTSKTKGIVQLWQDQREQLITRPFDVTTAMGGSFNFDPRGAWTAIDAGYSPNDQKHQVTASPVVEILAAWGLEHARPDEFETRNIRYAAWGLTLPPMLARAALSGNITIAPVKRFRFKLDMSGKNKIVTFSEQETIHD